MEVKKLQILEQLRTGFIAWQEARPHFNIKTVFPDIGIPILKIRWSGDHPVFMMGIPTLVRRRLYIETATRWLGQPCTPSTICERVEMRQCVGISQHKRQAIGARLITLQSGPEARTDLLIPIPDGLAVRVVEITVEDLWAPLVHLLLITKVGESVEDFPNQFLHLLDCVKSVLIILAT